MSTRVIIAVNDDCISCQACVGEAPRLFEISAETSKSHYIGPDELNPEDIELAEKAATICPVNAISVEKQ
ncbi:hypothetical protein PAPYR_7419 [Paratrimastix pyriformis]|uniref:Ferredoxin n=1 Tax=Paratrimastix pyriformis TaxID=342808 RepID=A0ABQ8UFJ6_9EUKA|nr:hypothetical protein PAPYR_7419 [Paratrimastix pyriformis]